MMDVVSISLCFILVTQLPSSPPLHSCVLLIKSQGLESRISYRTSIVDMKDVVLRQILLS